MATKTSFMHVRKRSQTVTELTDNFALLSQLYKLPVIKQCNILTEKMMLSFILNYYNFHNAEDWLEYIRKHHDDNT